MFVRTLKYFNIFRAVTGFIAALSLWACGPQPDHESDLSITGGQLLESNSGPTVALMKQDRFDNFYTFCSGVLIAHNKVLTAAHCYHREVSLSEFRIAILTAKPDNAPIESLYKVKKVNQYPGYSPRAMLRSKDGLMKPSRAGDLGVWELEKEVRQVLPATLVDPKEVDRYLVDHQLVLIMGFGKRDFEDSDFSAAQLAQATIPFFQSTIQTALVVKLEGGRPIKRKIPTRVRAISTHEFFLGGPGMPDTCKGDSGGPVFIKDPASSTLKVLGITSRGSSACSEGGLYSLVSSQSDWIRSFIH
jgi:secreted trypsin-like serine protease